MDLSSFADNATCLWLPGDGRELRIRRWKTTVLRAQLYPFRFSARPFNRQHTSEGREIAMAIDERKLNEEQKELVAVGQRRRRLPPVRQLPHQGGCESRSRW